jgi:hypothetical protein
VGGFQVQEKAAGTELGNDALPPMPNRSGPDTARLSINVLTTSPAAPSNHLPTENKSPKFLNAINTQLRFLLYLARELNYLGK